MESKEIEIRKRIEYLRGELTHERFHDGWVVAGIKQEFKQLQKKLKEIDENE